jgi:hypothetical protein
VCLHLRESDRARRHLARAVETNPNDPIILARWGHAQAYLGDAEAGLKTLAFALPHMLSPPRWYFIYCAPALLLARRPIESVAQMESVGRLDGPRDLAWYTIGCAHAGRVEEATRLAAAFIEAARAATTGLEVAEGDRPEHSGCAQCPVALDQPEADALLCGAHALDPWSFGSES